MSWIQSISYEQANAQLKKIYNRVKGPNNTIDNVLSIHSLRPHTLIGHMTLYKSVLHNSNNVLPKWYLEAIGVFVSYLNGCDYCVDHHLEGMKRLLQDEERIKSFWNALKNDALENFFDPSYYGGIHYAKKLTISLEKVDQEDIVKLSSLGFTDGEILEINQVSSYFNYVNRMVLGLGVSTVGDILGLSPSSSEDASDWNHK